MSDGQDPDRRWPRSVYGQGDEPDVRFSFANERTFLAWIRTGLGLLTAGVAIVALASVAPSLSLEAHIASVILLVTGVLCAANAFWRWARYERALRTAFASGLNTAAVVAGLTATVAGALVVTLVRTPRAPRKGVMNAGSGTLAEETVPPRR